MLFSLLDFWDRVAEVRDRVTGVWTAWGVGAVLVGACIAFLILESLWETMTSRKSQSGRAAASVRTTS